MNKTPDPVGTKSELIWGPGLTVLFSLAVLLANLVVLILVTLIFAFVQSAAEGTGDIHLRNIGHNGLYLSIATFASTAVTIPLILLIIYLRRGLSIRDYLGLSPIKFKTAAAWLIITTVWILIGDYATDYFDCTNGMETARQIYASAGFVPLLWVAIIIWGPLTEEIAFRGFAFTGLQKFWGNGATVLVTALLWALLHAGYEWCEVIIVFMSGIILGVARVRTGSLYPCLLMHAYINLLATMQAAGWI